MDQRDRDVLRGRRPWRLAALVRVFFLLVGCALAPRAALAAETTKLVPAAVEVTPGRYAPAAASQDPEVRRLGAEIDRTVAEALEDMGLDLVSKSGASAPADGDLPALAGGGWVFAPRFELRSGGALVRVVAVTPRSRVLLVREEDLEGSELMALAVRTVVMVRDVVEAGRRRAGEHPASARPSRVHRPPPPPRSSGRPVLALNSALLGGYLGFTMQRASGSSDSRLVYPMVALGAGLGLGASLLIADEWDIGEGDAWYLAAGIYWPGAAGFLIADSYGKKLEDRYLYGLVGATTGVGLGTVAIATGRMSEGGAVLTHSGGAFGMLLGAMTELVIDGDTAATPTRGMGFGSGAGVLAAGIVATQVKVPASRVLLVDLSASLGGLAGAALASPLLLVEESDPSRTRLWLGAATVGAIGGGVIGWYLTAPDSSDGSATRILPYASVTPGRFGPTLDLGISGRF